MRTQVVFQNPIPAAQLKFLAAYSGKMATAIRRDERFRSLMKLVIPQTEYHYARNGSLSATVQTLLGGDPMPIAVRDGRYVLVASRGGQPLGGRAFVWFDIDDGIALGGVYFQPADGEPAPELAIYSRQLRDTSLSMGQLPPAFQQDLAQWMLAAGPHLISARYFIPENGKMYALLHDEDYCAYLRDTALLAREQCEDMGAKAAQADVNAAYFTAQTHNAANAKAWTLGQEQFAWTVMRDQSCGMGPVGIPCRIRLNRQRTRVLLAPLSASAIPRADPKTLNAETERSSVRRPDEPVR